LKKLQKLNSIFINNNSIFLLSCICKMSSTTVHIRSGDETPVQDSDEEFEALKNLVAANFRIQGLDCKYCNRPFRTIPDQLSLTLTVSCPCGNNVFLFTENITIDDVFAAIVSRNTALPDEDEEPW